MALIYEIEVETDLLEGELVKAVGRYRGGLKARHCAGVIALIMADPVSPGQLDEPVRTALGRLVSAGKLRLEGENYLAVQ